MSKGFIKIDRRITEWRWWNNTNMRSLWLYILINAYWKDSFLYDGTEVKRGTFVTTLDRIAKENNISISSAKRYLKKLENGKEIELTGTNKYTVIKVLNYHKYQSFEDEEEKQVELSNDLSSGKRVANEWQTSELQKKKLKNSKKLNNSKNKNIIDKSLNIINKQFEEFWEEYPRKVAEANAKKSFIKKCTSEEIFKEIMDGLITQKKYVWAEREERYIPHPTTWLNQERWKDRVNPNVSTHGNKTIYDLLREELNNEQSGNNANTSDEIIDVQFTESSD